MSQEKLQTTIMLNFGGGGVGWTGEGVKELYYGICASKELVVYSH